MGLFKDSEREGGGSNLIYIMPYNCTPHTNFKYTSIYIYIKNLVLFDFCSHLIEIFVVSSKYTFSQIFHIFSKT